MSSEFEVYSPKGESPKSTGFCIVIPDLPRLQEWVRSYSSRFADYTDEDLENHKHEFLFNNIFGGGDTGKWSVNIKDRLVDDINIEIYSRYNEGSGPFCNIDMGINLIDVSQTWEVPKRWKQLASILRNQGFGVVHNKDDKGCHGLLITDPRWPSEPIHFNLGYKNLEKALARDEDAEEYGNNPLIVAPLSAGYTLEVVDKLRALQTVGSFVVDALYRVFDQEPPSRQLSLSLEE